ncbi:MAG: hypothetical protein ABJB85_09185 [Nitrososphaerota archaeon]
MYPIVERRFTLDVINYHLVSLGKTERRFLNLLAVGDESAYGLCSHLKKREDQISYKNVRKTIKSLYSKGLIEETREKLPHGAIEYRFTSHGLFQCLLNCHTIPSLMKKEYQNSLLMKNILYQYFEIDTIKEFLTIPRINLIATYLSNCCKAILEKVIEFHYSKFEDKINFIFDDMQFVIRKEILKLLFEIVMTSNLKTIDFVLTNDNNIEYKRSRYKVGEDDVEKGKDNKNYLDLFPTFALRNDKKFVSLLKEIRDDFLERSQKFI